MAAVQLFGIKTDISYVLWEPIFYVNLSLPCIMQWKPSFCEINGGEKINDAYGIGNVENESIIVTFGDLWFSCSS